MSKWVEGRCIHTNNSKETCAFLHDDIIYRYGSLIIIRIDGGIGSKGEFQ